MFSHPENIQSYLGISTFISELTRKFFSQYLISLNSKDWHLDLEPKTRYCKHLCQLYFWQ